MLYNPKAYQNFDTNEALTLMQKNPFATVIAMNGNDFDIAHLPMLAKIKNGAILLEGHLARANPLWKNFPKKIATVIFHGAHTYITAAWYHEHDVPTWNYSVVHARGEVQLIEDYEGISQILRESTEHMEKYWPSGWQFSVPEDLSKNKTLTKAILGFRVHVTSLDYKKKLSQTRSAVDIQGILKGLSERQDENSQSILQEMKKIFS